MSLSAPICRSRKVWKREAILANKTKNGRVARGEAGGLYNHYVAAPITWFSSCVVAWPLYAVPSNAIWPLSINIYKTVTA